MQRAIFTLAALSLGLASGCQSVQPSGAQIASGQLGNGGFAFECDDSVACDRYTHAAKTFPDAIALGSTFRVRYVPKDGSSASGVTVGGVGNGFISPGYKGDLTAIKAGWGTFVARDSSGQIIDFVSIPIQRPDALVVYDASYVGDVPPSKDKITIQVGDYAGLRALARHKNVDLGGALQYEWVSSNDNVVHVDAPPGGKATLTAVTAGSAKLKVSGGTFEESVDVEVTP